MLKSLARLIGGSDEAVVKKMQPRIDELNEQFDTKIPEDEDVETIGGFMALRLGKIPATGDQVDVNGHSFTVTEANERRVSRVLIKLK